LDPARSGGGLSAGASATRLIDTLRADARESLLVQVLFPIGHAVQAAKAAVEVCLRTV
jgi:hypothetical protein